jgi:MFS family permease
MNRGNVLRHPGFLRVLAGSAAALLGDQFTFIAIPWLVLRLSKDSLVLGTVIAFMSLPRVIFLLLAGALVDRYSPRIILILASLVGALALGSFGALVIHDAVNLWMLYGFATLIGLVSTFTMPARMAILPMVVAPEQLQSANSIMMGATQLSVLAGPVLAGILVSTPAGMGGAFVIDCVCFAIAAVSVPPLMRRTEQAQDGERKPMLHAIFEGFRWLWNDHVLRLLIGYWIMAAFFAIGAIQVGLPLLVEKQLGLNSTAFGMLVSVNGVGQVLGILMSGLRVLKKIPLGVAVCLTDMLAGLAMVGMGVNHVLAVALVLVGTIGVGAGYVQVGLYTWIQHRIPSHLLGRVISILGLVMTTVMPLSALLAGTVTHYVAVPMLFMIMGGMLCCFALAALASPTIRGVRAVDAAIAAEKGEGEAAREDEPMPEHVAAVDR